MGKRNCVTWERENRTMFRRERRYSDNVAKRGCYWTKLEIRDEPFFFQIERGTFKVLQTRRRVFAEESEIRVYCAQCRLN